MCSSDLPGAAAATTSGATPSAAAPTIGGPRPILPPGVREVFLAPRGPVDPEGRLVYRPAVLGRARVRYSRFSSGIEVDREVIMMAPAGDSLGESAWESGARLPAPPQVEPAPRPGSFTSLPAALAGPRGYATLATSLKGFLGRTKLTAFAAPAIDAVSRPDETEGEFRARIAQRVREWRDGEIEKVREKHAAKLAALVDRIDRARQKVEREKAEAKNQSMQTYVSIGSAVIGALLGRKKVSATNIGRAATSMRSASRAARQQADVAHAEESLASLEEKRMSLEETIEEELEKIRLDSAPERIVLEEIEVPAKKTDIAVDDVVLAWVPDEPPPRAERSPWG
mgnify:CR=1 FL=1